MILIIFSLTILWLALQESFTFADVIVGAILAALVTFFTRRALVDWIRDLRTMRSRQNYPNVLVQIWHVIAFIGFSLWNIVKSNFQVAKIVLSPTIDIRPAIIAVPLDVKSDAGITLLANLITLTPGTVSMDISDDKRTIYIHSIDIDNPNELRNEIKGEFERRVMEIFP